GEPAGRGADVERLPAVHIKPERLERVVELAPAARHEGRRLRYRDLDVLADELPRLLRRAPLGPEPDLTGEHRGSGARARRKHSALGEQGVEPDLGHGRERYRPGGPRPASTL